MRKAISKIYFLKAGDSIKIGTTNSTFIRDRISALQTGNPIKIELLGVMLGGTSVERKLHEKFSKFRRSGEWFYYSDEIKEFIDSFAVTSSGVIKEIEGKEEEMIDFKIKEKCYKDEIAQLKLNIFKLKDAVHTSIYGLAETYCLYSKLQEKMMWLYFVEPEEYKPNNELSENVSAKPKLRYTDICPKLHDSIYKAFCNAAEGITRTDWRWARRFLINCEDGDLCKLTNNALEHMMEFTLKIKDTEDDLFNQTT